ncbi:hypothetical protein KRR40_08975 [Niabella defluvii]|nr:hypothetical protein KRR40_08975 [Niabella sp. I65]
MKEKDLRQVFRPVGTGTGNTKPENKLPERDDTHCWLTKGQCFFSSEQNFRRKVREELKQRHEDQKKIDV